MNSSSLAKLKLWLCLDSAFLSHPNDEARFHDFLHHYVLSHDEFGSESDISEKIHEYANRDPDFVQYLISDALTSYHAVVEFIKRQS